MKKIILILFIVIISLISGCVENKTNDVSEEDIRNEIESLKQQNHEMQDKIEEIEGDVLLNDAEKSNQINRIEQLLLKMPEIKCKTVYIDNYDREKRQISVNEIEWISNKERLKEIGRDPDIDMPNGFYIYDKNYVIDTYKLSEDIICELLDSNFKSEIMIENDFWTLLEDKKIRESYPFNIYIINGEVVDVIQRYIP